MNDQHYVGVLWFAPWAFRDAPASLGPRLVGDGREGFGVSGSNDFGFRRRAYRV